MSSVLLAKRHHQRRLMLLPTSLVVLMAMKAWGSSVSPSIGNISVLSMKTVSITIFTGEPELNCFSRFMSFPLIQQANSWVGYFLCYIIIMGIYYSNAWNVSPPLLSLLQYLICMKVSSFPDVVHLNLLRQRIDLWSVGCVRPSIPAQPNCAGRGRSPSSDRLERVEEPFFESSSLSRSFWMPDLFLISLGNPTSRSVVLSRMSSYFGALTRSTRLNSHTTGINPTCITRWI